MNENPSQEATASNTGWVSPTVELISLDCEISSYAPVDDGDAPLF